MGLTITAGRTWVESESVTPTKLNNSFSAATVDFAAYQDASGTFNAANGDFVWITQGDTVNLPTSPSNNDIVVVAQSHGDLSSVNATISGGSKNINFNNYKNVAAATSLTIDANFIGNITFTFNTSQDAWKIT